MQTLNHRLYICDWMHENWHTCWFSCVQFLCEKGAWDEARVNSAYCTSHLLCWMWPDWILCCVYRYQAAISACQVIDWLTSCQSSCCIRTRGGAVNGIVWIIGITQEPQDIAAVGRLGQLLDSCQPMQWTGVTVLCNVAMEIPTLCKRSGTYKAKNLNNWHGIQRGHKIS